MEDEYQETSISESENQSPSKDPALANAEDDDGTPDDLPVIQDKSDVFDPDELEVIQKELPDGTIKRVRRRIIIVEIGKKVNIAPVKIRDVEETPNEEEERGEEDSGK